MSTPTIHNKALKGEIAKTVLMPGDPLRAKFIAENFLSNYQMVNDVRLCYAYTGKFNGKDVSVMASGMGAGSMGIYSYELFNDYEVERIVRVGSAGALSPSLKLGDVVVALSTSTDSGYASHLGLSGSYAPTVSAKPLTDLLKQCNLNENKECIVHLGPVFSGVAFHYDEELFRKWSEMGMLAVEMETAALYTNAAKLKKEAIALFTISDLIFGNAKYTTKERETSFEQMIELALSLVVS